MEKCDVSVSTCSCGKEPMIQDLVAAFSDFRDLYTCRGCKGKLILPSYAFARHVCEFDGWEISSHVQGEHVQVDVFESPVERARRFLFCFECSGKIFGGSDEEESKDTGEGQSEGLGGGPPGYADGD